MGFFKKALSSVLGVGIPGGIGEIIGDKLGEKIDNKLDKTKEKIIYSIKAEENGTSDPYYKDASVIVGKAFIKNPGMLSSFPVDLMLETKKAYDKSLREEGFQNGYRQSNVDAAKKFAALLEQSDNMRIGSFALGYHVARLGDGANEKLGVIVDALGEPNSFALSPYVLSENKKIHDSKPSFDEIRRKYLDSLNIEQLKSIDGFLQEIINAGGSSESEKNFYQNEWQNYLNRRNVK